MGCIPTNEFLMWSNCGNNCKFCWQKKRADQRTILNESEKIASIDACMSMLSNLRDSDVLIVGGEVYAPQEPSVNAELSKLFALIANKIKLGEIRYFYVNTNLAYNDMVNIDSLMTAFIGIESSIKFTTSYDVYGRFASIEEEDAFIERSHNLTVKYPMLKKYVT